jgi:cytochrome c oxidase cbb3-type subunit 3
MSDFINSGWAWYVAGLTVVSLAFCVFILVVASKRKVMAADNTTGHVWDEDLRETEQPAAALVDVAVRHHHRAFAGGIYLAAVPGPGHQPRRASSGRSTGQWEAEQQKAYAHRDGAGVTPSYTAMPAAEALAKDSAGHGHRRAAVRQQLRPVPWVGRPRGSKGFPNLTDT